MLKQKKNTANSRNPKQNSEAGQVTSGEGSKEIKCQGDDL